MGIYNKFIKILFHMKIRLNELRSIIKNILKEYIEYPQVQYEPNGMHLVLN